MSSLLRLLPKGLHFDLDSEVRVKKIVFYSDVIGLYYVKFRNKMNKCVHII